MWRRLVRSKIVSGLFLLSLLLILGGSLWAYVVLGKIREPLILHFNSLVGINQIGTLWDLLRVGVLGLVVVVVNFCVAMTLEERDRFLGGLVAAATVFFSILIFTGFAAIISVN